MYALREAAETRIRKLQLEDRGPIKGLLERIPQFTDEEKQCALELADIYINQGEKSGYDFIVSEDRTGKLLGYICFGKIPLTDACFDIYWIVVDPGYQGKGIGTQLLNAVEERLIDLGARKIFVETSGKENYLLAQAFYQKTDFRLVSHIKDFYKAGDSKLVYVKDIERYSKDAG